MIVSTATMHIGELAERTGLSLRTIRHYDDVGLLPATARTDGGFRLYAEADYERLIVVRAMKPLGFSLEQMAEILMLLSPSDGENPAGSATEVADRLASYRKQAIHQREKMARNLAQADGFIQRLDGGSYRCGD